MTIEQIEAMLTDIAERLARVDAELKAIHEENEATAARLDEIGQADTRTAAATTTTEGGAARTG